MQPTDQAPDLLNSERFRALALSRLLPAPAPHDDTLTSPSDYDLNPDIRPDFMPWNPSAKPLTPAAVLVPVCARERPTVILTERTAHLSSHAGQIAFPGGRIDAGDRDATAAALREATEEIGLHPSLVEPLGFLEPYRTGTGYLITPVVAIVQPNFTPRPNLGEVAAVFEVPLSFLMDAANHRIDARHWKGADRRFYAMPFEQHYIWGATAGILKTLHRRLFTS